MNVRWNCAGRNEGVTEKRKEVQRKMGLTYVSSSVNAKLNSVMYLLMSSKIDLIYASLSGHLKARIIPSFFDIERSLLGGVISRSSCFNFRRHSSNTYSSLQSLPKVGSRYWSSPVDNNPFSSSIKFLSRSVSSLRVVRTIWRPPSSWISLRSSIFAFLADLTYCMHVELTELVIWSTAIMLAQTLSGSISAICYGFERHDGWAKVQHCIDDKRKDSGYIHKDVTVFKN